MNPSSRLVARCSFPPNGKRNSFFCRILDPSSKFLTIWNRVFLAFCLTGLFMDPLSFYVPYVGGSGCVAIDESFLTAATVIRTIVDISYLIQMILKFRTAFILPGSTVIGRGELVMDPYQIASRYFYSDCIIDFVAILPIAQILNWVIIPQFKHRTAQNAYTLGLFVLVQYALRLFLIFPLYSRTVRNTGVVTETTCAGVAYNLSLFLLSGHVVGASWYLVSIQRLYDCWSLECLQEMDRVDCLTSFLDCKSLSDEGQKLRREVWLNTTHILHNCNPANEDIHFKYGIFQDALTSTIFSTSFLEKYFYCLWFGLKSISSFGQSLFSSGYLPETTFSYLICTMGLILFGLLIGNVQRYLQSTTSRIEEWRVKRREIEEWMRIRQLPEDLQKRVRQFVQFKWVATRGVDERTILRSLPRDHRRDIHRHLCLSLVHQVPFFSHMDKQLLDAICERLVSSLSIGNTVIVCEGDPVHEMLFIIRGKLESYKSHEGRNGIYSSFIVGPGDFCGEELLNWALKPNQSSFLPLSTRTVRSLCDIEGFSLQADDINYVASQFQRFNSRKLKYAFRSSSPKWRTWAACFIQAAWKQYIKMKKEEKDKEEKLARNESSNSSHSQHESMEGDLEHICEESSLMGATNNVQRPGMLPSRFVANIRKIILKKAKVMEPEDSNLATPKLILNQDGQMEGDYDDDSVESSSIDSTNNFMEPNGD